MAWECAPPMRAAAPVPGGGGPHPRELLTGMPVVKACWMSVRSDCGKTPGRFVQTVATFDRKRGFDVFGAGCEPGVALNGTGVAIDVPPPVSPGAEHVE